MYYVGSPRERELPTGASRLPSGRYAAQIQAGGKKINDDLHTCGNSGNKWELGGWGERRREGGEEGRREGEGEGEERGRRKGEGEERKRSEREAETHCIFINSIIGEGPPQAKKMGFLGCYA